jgi:predicted DNA-binding transcriptional regulator AlpA
MGEKLLLTARDVENVYGIPRSTQAKGRMTGRFCPHVKRGRSVFYLKADIEAWLSSLRRVSTSDTGRDACR